MSAEETSHAVFDQWVSGGCLADSYIGEAKKVAICSICKRVATSYKVWSRTTHGYPNDLYKRAAEGKRDCQTKKSVMEIPHISAQDEVTDNQ